MFEQISQLDDGLSRRRDFASYFVRLFDGRHGDGDHLLARWLFLRALGVLYFSAFFSLVFQIQGLIGPDGLLPAGSYLQRVIEALGARGFWYAPTLLWFSAGSHMLTALCWIGMVASLLVVLNLVPRWALLVCFISYLSFVAAAQDFSGYQSDGMLLAAGFLCLFYAPNGVRPRLGVHSGPARALRLLLLWEWFRIYFESGLAKLLSGDPTWRNLTAMYDYYQNGPLPTWIGWYLQHLPHWFQKGTAGLTLLMELGLIFLAFLPRPVRNLCFCIVTLWQIGVILTANYAFLNYLVLILGFLLLDDTTLRRFVPTRMRKQLPVEHPEADIAPVSPQPKWRRMLHWVQVDLLGVMLLWIFYATLLPLVQMFWHEIPLPEFPVTALAPFRIANRYGLFAVMTPARYLIVYEGSNDGMHWQAYSYRFQPQAPAKAPGIYAPYQPRFDWNLWFASLGSWQQYPFVVRGEILLLQNDPAVLQLFAGNPFPDARPKYIRTVVWQYWFSTPEEKRTQHIWWTRKLLGEYAPALERLPNGHVEILDESSAPLSTEP